MKQKIKVFNENAKAAAKAANKAADKSGAKRGIIIWKKTGTA